MAEMRDEVMKEKWWIWGQLVCGLDESLRKDGGMEGVKKAKEKEGYKIEDKWMEEEI